MAGLLDYLFDPSTYSGQGGLLSRLQPMMGQIQQSAGFPEVPQQPNPIPVGGNQMPRVGNPDMYQPQQVMTPPNAQPAQGQLPQMPQQPPALPALAGNPSGGEGFRQGFAANTGNGLFSALAGGIAGSAGLREPDARTVARQNLQAQFQAYQQAGLSPEKAMLAVLNPKAAEVFLPQIAAKYQAHNVGNTTGAFNPTTGEFRPSYTEPKYEKVGPGENLFAVGGPGGQARSVASGGPEKPPAGYKWVDENDTSKGLTAIPNGPATHLPSETAGRVAMMETAAAELPGARTVLMNGRTQFGAGKGNVAGSVTGIGDYARAERTVKLAIEGALRAMTGAAAPEVEVKRYQDLFMPGKFDSRETATQKLNQLDDFIANATRLVKQGRGPAAPQGRASDPLGIR